MTKEEKLASIHEEALKRFDEIQSAVREVRLQCLEDRRFCSVTGAQWEGWVGEQFQNKPQLEFNKVHLSVLRIHNEYRNNRITVDFVPRDGEPHDMADTCAGLYRADEQDSTADEAYDNAFEEGSTGGFGAWRLRAEYEDESDEDDEKQRIRLEPIFDADSCVFFDLDAKRQDKADAKYCFVLTALSHGAYEDEYGEGGTSWNKTITKTEFDWVTPDVIYVAEYYVVEKVKELVRVFRGLDGSEEKHRQSEFDDDPTLEDYLSATGFREVRQKKITKKRVHKYILSGSGVEEDCGYIPGEHIPIVPYFGKRWIVDNIERCMGHVRLAKDAQMLFNSLMSWLTDMAARFDVEKPIVTPEQVAGHAESWARDNVDRYAFLMLNALRDADGNPMPSGPVAYTKAPNVPPAMAALIQIAIQALDDLLGNQQAGEELQPNLSGKAVELIQNRLDMQTFIYMSNLKKSMKRSGEIWLSMAKELFVESKRKMKLISSDGKVDSVTLNTPGVDHETGEQITMNSLTEEAFDVVADVGPSSSSRRASTVRALTNMAQITTDEQDRSVLISAAMMNMEGEGIGDLRDYYRNKLLRLGVVKPTKEEAAQLQAEMQNQQPDPQQQYLLAAAEQAQADAAQSRAKTVETIASADLKRAMTSKTLAEAMGEHHQQQIASVQMLQNILSAQQSQQSQQVQQPQQAAQQI